MDYYIVTIESGNVDDIMEEMIGWAPSFGLLWIGNFIITSDEFLSNVKECLNNLNVQFNVAVREI